MRQSDTIKAIPAICGGANTSTSHSFCCSTSPPAPFPPDASDSLHPSSNPRTPDPLPPAEDPTPIVGAHCHIPRAGKHLRNFELYGKDVVWVEKVRQKPLPSYSLPSVPGTSTDEEKERTMSGDPSPPHTTPSLQDLRNGDELELCRSCTAAVADARPSSHTLTHKSSYPATVNEDYSTAPSTSSQPTERSTFCRQCIGTGQWSVFAINPDYASKPVTYKTKIARMRDGEDVNEQMGLLKSRSTGSYTIPTAERSMHAEDCPFCIGHEDRCPTPLFQITQPTKLPKSPESSSLTDPSSTSSPSACAAQTGRWLVRVLPNKYSYLDRFDPFVTCSFWGLHPEVSGSGIQEVIVSHRQHNTCPGIMTFDDLLLCIKILQVRGRLAAMDPRVRYVALFENHGVLAGGSLEHPHFQVVGLPVIPTVVVQRLEWARRFYTMHEQCVFCRMLEDELSDLEGDGSRVVYRNDSVVAFVPYAPAREFQIIIMPIRHSCDFLSTAEGDVRDLSEAIGACLSMLYVCLGDPDYNLIIRTAPTVGVSGVYDATRGVASQQDGCDEDGFGSGWGQWYHWYVDIMPHTSKWGGVSCFDMVVHKMLPETMAKKLRAE